MLVQRRRRWLEVVQMLYKCFGFAGITVTTSNAVLILDECCASIADGGPTLKQHWFIISCLFGFNIT